jgi:hypothetical protein
VNRYMIAGILADMRDGKEVLLLSESSVAARDAFENMAACIESGEVTVRTVGKERIHAYGKGAVRFRSIRSHLDNNVAADVVVADVDARDHQEQIERLWFHFARLGKSVELVQH